MCVPQLQKFQARLIRRNGEALFKSTHVNPLLRIIAIGQGNTSKTLTEKEIRAQARATAAQGTCSLSLSRSLAHSLNTHILSEKEVRAQALVGGLSLIKAGIEGSGPFSRFREGYLGEESPPFDYTCVYG